MYADHFVPQLRHCRLRNVNKHTLKAGQGAAGMGHWVKTLPTAPLTKWPMVRSNGGCNTGLGLHHRAQGTFVASNDLERSSCARHRWRP